MLFIIVSFHHQSEVIFYGTNKWQTDFRLQSYISFTEKADTILLI